MLKIEIDAPATKFVYDKKNLKKVMRAAGNEVAAVTRSLLRKSVGGGQIYRGPGGSAKYRGGYKSGSYQASLAGMAPARVTGTLLSSIKARPFPSGEGVAIRDSAFYALFLMAGASGGGRLKRGGERVKGKGGIGKVRRLDPRPFFEIALNARRDSLQARIEASVQQDIAFVRLRP